MSNRHLTLVLGGARSGKSALAERLAGQTGLPRVYIATATAEDAEMQARIAAHRARRDTGWKTLEAPLDLCGTLRNLSREHVCLVDCLTLWASNRMLAGHDPETDLAELIGVLGEADSRLILVSNEIGMGLVPDTPMGRRFRDIQGRLNQSVAQRADTVLFIAAGLPLALKGTIPAGLA